MRYRDRGPMKSWRPETMAEAIWAVLNEGLSLSQVLLYSFPSHIDQKTVKTPNPKCRLYWCLIEFIDWRYNQSYWYFRPLLQISAPLPSLQFALPPPLCVNRYRFIHSTHTVCNRAGGGGGRGLDYV
jgi:hypothetical protein